MESIDFDMFNALFWYLMGIFSYKIISKVLNLIASLALFQEALLSSIALLKHASDNYELASNHAYENRAESDREGANHARDGDQKALEFWRRLAVINIVNMTPKRFRAMIVFDDWRGAMKYLNKKGIEDAEY